MQASHVNSSPRNQVQVAYSRAAYRALTRLDEARRMKVARLVSGVAANAGHIVQRASTTFSADVESGLRIVFLQTSAALTVLALTGDGSRP